jgi:hypothetical protein
MSKEEQRRKMQIERGKLIYFTGIFLNGIQFILLPKEVK